MTCENVMDLDLKRLQQVLTVARVGSISEAAEELHLTQPALSRSIALLEDRYGFRIFERGRGGATLTAVGKSVVREAEALLRQASSIDHNFRLYSSGEAGEIAFGMGPLMASLILPSLSLYCLQHRPNLHLKAVAKAATVLYQELIDDRIEIFFCAEGQLQGKPDLAMEVVGEISLGLIVRSEHPLAHQQVVSLDEMAAYSILSGDEMPIMKQDVNSGSLVCDNYNILREVVLQSDAVWISSPQFVAKEIRDGRLKALALPGSVLQSTMSVCMVSRSANRLSPVALFVRDYVRDRLSALSADPVA